MIATDTQGRKWFVAEGTLEPIGHAADPDTLTKAAEEYLIAQLPPPATQHLGEESFGI